MRHDHVTLPHGSRTLQTAIATSFTLNYCRCLSSLSTDGRVLKRSIAGSSTFECNNSHGYYHVASEICDAGWEKTISAPSFYYEKPVLYLYILFWAIFDHPCIIFVARERRQSTKLLFARPLILIPTSFAFPCLITAQSR
jgi:hypothetical protein